MHVVLLTKEDETKQMFLSALEDLKEIVFIHINSLNEIPSLSENDVVFIDNNCENNFFTLRDPNIIESLKEKTSARIILDSDIESFLESLKT